MSAPVLNSLTADRLAKILGLCGSAHAGERAAAAKMADDLVRGLGLTWRDVITPAVGPPEPPPRHAGRSDDDDDLPHWREQLAVCLDNIDALNERDAHFLMSLAEWRRPLSDKQAI